MYGIPHGAVSAPVSGPPAPSSGGTSKKSSSLVTTTSNSYSSSHYGGGASSPLPPPPPGPPGGPPGSAAANAAAAAAAAGAPHVVNYHVRPGEVISLQMGGGQVEVIPGESRRLLFFFTWNSASCFFLCCDWRLSLRNWCDHFFSYYQPLRPMILRPR